MDDIKIYRTSELTDSMWEEILYGYKVCFNQETSIEKLKTTYSASVTGEAIHAIKLSEEGKIIGHNYFQPRPYNHNGEDIILALSGGTYVLPEYRKDIFIFYDLFQACMKEARKLGWKAQVGVPNKNSFQYGQKITKSKHIGDLNYYILPVKISKFINKKGLKFLDIPCNIVIKAHLALNSLIYTLINPHERDVKIRLSRKKDFMEKRCPNSVYNILTEKEYTAYYKIYDENSIKTAYIIDFTENDTKTAKALSRTIKKILKNEKIDAILYVGTMNFRQFSLFKVPHKYDPQKLPVTVDYIDKNDEKLKTSLSDIKNIDFGLLNFDVR